MTSRPPDTTDRASKEAAPATADTTEEDIDETGDARGAPSRPYFKRLEYLVVRPKCNYLGMFEPKYEPARLVRGDTPGKSNILRQTVSSEGDSGQRQYLHVSARGMGQGSRRDPVPAWVPR